MNIVLLLLLKVRKCVLKNKRGGILFYVLSFFIFFMIFFESALGVKIKQIQVKDAYNKVELRLRIEKKVIDFYRDNVSVDDLFYDFYEEEVYVWTARKENKIKVNLSGAITHAFYYVIMEDGSFTFTTVEEKT